MKRDLHSNVSPVLSIAPAAYDDSVNGEAADLANYQSADIQIHVGAYTDGTHTFVVEHSDDATTWEAAEAGDLQGEGLVLDGDADDETVYAVGYVGAKRYVRVSSTVAGATDGAVYGATIVRGHPRFVGNTLMDPGDS